MAPKTADSGRLLFLAFIGALVLLFGVGAGYWYVAHQFGWWTFALVFVGTEVFWQSVKSAFKEARK